MENPPDGVYYPTHVEGMAMAGRQSREGFDCALTYTYPHRFWLVTGTRREKVEVGPDDAVHLMPVVWHAETGVVPPDRNPSVTVRRDGEAVTELSPWAMLSQTMGFHFGDNVQLPEDGTYEVEVRLAPASTNRTGSLAETAAAAPTFTFELDYDRADLDELPFRDIPADTEGTEGTVEPMEMEGVPSTRLPSPDSFPGTVRGTAESGDVRHVVTTFDDASRFGGSGEETYLAVSPRTPYNRYPLPLTSLSAALSGENGTAFDGALTPALDPDLGYYYGASVPGVGSGAELTVTVDSPPQIARHEGYETAFFDTPEATLTL